MANFISPEKQKAAKELFAAGMSIRAVMRQLSISKQTAHSYRRISHVPRLCECGDISGHHGWCHVRFANSPARQAFMHEMHLQQSANTRPNYTCQFFLGLGFFWGSKPIASAKCEVRSCCFPQRQNGLCRLHLIDESLKFSMTDSSIDRGDFYNDSSTTATTNLRVITPAEFRNGWASRWNEPFDTAKEWLHEQELMSFEAAE